MSAREARRKTLFTVPPSADEPPELLGGRCRCGHRFFPPHRFGCEACGAAGDQLSEIRMAARGVIRAYAATHFQMRRDGQGPRVVGAVLLDEGVRVVGTIECAGEGALRVGERVSGRLVEVGEEGGRAIVDLVFVPEGGAA